MKIPDEHAEQKNLIEWTEIQGRKYPELKLIFAIPNGGQRNKIIAAKLKAEGVKKGVPDLMLPVARGGFHGLFVEMKRRKGGQVSADQKAWIVALKAQGYRVEVCKGWPDAMEVIMDYLRSDAMREVA